MKMQAPENCCGLVHAGRFIAVGDDGRVEVDEADVAALTGHGFVAIPDAPVADDATADAPNIEAMGRAALFAYLREQGVAVTLPITNEALRAAAREAARG